MKVQDVRAIVTGAGSGLGRCFARELLRAGASVAAVDLDGASLDSLHQECPDRPDALHLFPCDITQENAVEAMSEAAWGAMGGFNTLINCAGIFRDRLLVKKDRDTGAIQQMSLAEWQPVIDVDLTGPFLCTRAFAARMLEADARPGVIVNISSSARVGNVGQSNYSAAKAGLVADTRVWARELSRHGIRVGAIAPGFVDTPILQGMRPDVLAAMLRKVPLGRAGQPEEIWAGVRFILECDYFTGRCLDIDGGIAMG